MSNSVQGGAPASRSGKRSRILLILIPVLVLLLAAVLILPRVVNLDGALRFFRYMGLRDKESYGKISFEAGAGNVYAGFDDGLLVGTESGLTLYSLDGEQKAFIQGSLPTPVLRTGGGLGLLFSPGSSYAAAVGEGGEIRMDSAASGAYLNADLSSDGYLAVLSSESGSKAVATVYNPELEPVFRFSSRTRYLNACAVNEKGSLLAVAGLEEQNSIYRSGITILRTDEPITDLDQENSGAVRLELGNQVIYELRFLDRSHLLALSQEELIFFNAQGEILRSISLRDSPLTDYSVSREGWVLAALSGNGGSRILTLDVSGEILGEEELQDRVLSVSAEEGCGAVLTELYLQIYDRRLEPLNRSWDTLAATHVVARSDGTALLIGSGGTRLYIP